MLGRLVAPDPNSFNVLCHGDTWSNNLLYSYDENRNPNEVIFIDFQLSFWGTQSFDVYYTFATSSQPQVKRNEFDNIIHIYHSELVSNLSKLKYTGKILSLDELFAELMKTGLIPAIWAIGLPLTTLDGTEAANLHNFVNDDEAADTFKKSIYQSEKYSKLLEALYLFLDERGQLDMPN